MPIYEFYCPDCHAVYSFFSAGVDTESRPACPRCRRPRLGRRPSRFAMLKRAGTDGEEAPDPLDALDESRLEGAMATLMEEMGGAGNDEDPRAMGRMMRRFSQLSGLEMGERLEAMVERLEAGEDPDALEDEIGEEPDGDGFEDFFKLKKALAAGRRRKRPRVDDELFFL